MLDLSSLRRAISISVSFELNCNPWILGFNPFLDMKAPANCLLKVYPLLMDDLENQSSILA
jgi:hypothetical protein